MSFMQDVALYKINHHLAIEDVEREAVVVEKSKAASAKYSLDGDSTTEFTRSLISAAKAIQYRYRADLLNTPTTHTPRNLTTEIRPKLIILGEQINKEIARYLKEEGAFIQQDLSLFKAALNTRYLTEIDKREELIQNGKNFAELFLKYHTQLQENVQEEDELH